LSLGPSGPLPMMVSVAFGSVATMRSKTSSMKATFLRGSSAPQ
jgi:hypothetical protein